MIIVEENTIIIGAGGGSNVSSLNDLTDVDTTGVSAGAFLVYRAADPNMGITAGWIPTLISLSMLNDTDDMGAPGLNEYLGYNTTSGYWEPRHIELSHIDDIDLTGVSAGNVLVYDTSGTTPKWVPGSPGTSYTAGDGIDITNGEITIEVNNTGSGLYELDLTSAGLSATGPEPVAPLEATSATIWLNYDNKTIGKDSLNQLCTKSLSVTDSNATVTLSNIANNTVYHLTASAGVESLTLSSLASDFEYATIIFTSDATTHSFGKPSAWQCVGSGCSGGDFTPEASKRYVLAIVDEDDQITIYVTETPF